MVSKLLTICVKTAGKEDWRLMNLLLSPVNDAHDMPACVVHHVFHDDSLDLLNSILHLSHARHGKSLESSRFYQ